MVVMFCLSPLFTRSEPLQGKPLTISIKNTSLAEVLRQVSKKSGLYIYFQDVDLAAFPSVTIDVKNKSVDAVLHELLDGRGLTWVVVDKNSVAVRKKEVVSLVDNYTDSVITVTGRVINEKGEPIIGATIIVKNTKRGTTSNSNGDFILDRVKENAVLIISSVSFLTKEMAISRRNSTGIIQLKRYVGELDETVVVAYGTTTQRFNAGNVNVIKAVDIQKQPVNNPLLALSGRVPGLFINQSSGIAGGGIKLLIQGQNSISNGNEPFYVIDGVPYTSQLLPSINGDLLGYSGVNNSSAGNPLNYINPSDIESISVLKDADATAIYGSRAANGAILITTRKGKSGQMKIDINLQQGWGKITRKAKLLDNKKYIEMRNEAIKNDNVSVQPSDFDINGVWDSTKNTDWQKELIGGVARYSKFNISTSGGTDISQYLISGNYYKETSVMPGDFADTKGSIHFNLNSTSSDKKLKLQIGGSFMSDINKLPFTDLTSVAVQLAPTSPSLYNLDGSINWMPDSNGSTTFFQNPAAQLQNKYSNKTNNLIGNAMLSYSISKELDVISSFGYTYLNSNELSTVPLSSFIPEDKPYAARQALYGNNAIYSWIAEPQITYKKMIGKFRTNVVLGTTIQQNRSNGQQLTGIGYNSDNVLEDIFSASSVAAVSSTATVYKYNALFGRINAIYNDKYILDLNARRDGSSRFGVNNQFHNFGSVALAWIFSQEILIKNNFSFISFGKIRGSYGITGNDQIGDYKFLDLYAPLSTGVAYQGITSLVSKGLVNPYLQWEETRKLQIGLEMGFLKDLIFFTANYSRNRSSNQLLNYKLPILTGFHSIVRNFPALIENRGWEFSLSSTNINSNKFTWKTNLNLTVPNNKLVEFPNLSQSSYANSLIIGKPINISKVLEFAGVNKTTGLYEFVDSKGITTSTPSLKDDAKMIINKFPYFYGGIENSFTWNNFDLSFLFQFVKQQTYDYSLGNNPGIPFNNQPVSVLSRWEKEGDSAPVQRFSTFNNADALSTSNFATSSNVVYSIVWYLRMKNLSFSYKLPPAIISKLHCESSRVFIQGQNLLTFTNYNGIDPETASLSNLPPLRVIMLGLQIVF